MAMFSSFFLHIINLRLRMQGAIINMASSLLNTRALAVRGQ